MNQLKPMFIGTALTLAIVFGYDKISNSDVNFGGDPKPNATVIEFHPKVVEAFDDAEKEHLDEVKPNPNPNPNPIGPHPDPDKCVCKGTGIITHGDGHTTPCPYHGNRQPPQPNNVDLLNRINELSHKVDNLENVVIDSKPAMALSKKIERKRDRPLNNSDTTYYQLMVFSSNNSDQSLRLKKELEVLDQTNIKVGNDKEDDIRFLDIERYPSYYRQWKGEFDRIPLFLENIDGKLHGRSEGYKSLYEILEQYDLEE